jgi:acetyl esterase/lipase
MSCRILLTMLTGLVAFQIGARAQPLPISAFASLPKSQSVAISPDGKRIAALSNVKGRWGVIIRVLDNPESPPLVFKAPDGPLEVRWLRWANDDWILAGLGTLANRRYLGENTRETRMMAIAADGSKAINPVRPGKSAPIGSIVPQQNATLTAIRQDDVIDFTPEDPKTILVSIIENQYSESSATVRKIDVATGAYTAIMSGRPHVWRYLTDTKNEVRLGFGSLISGDKYNQFYDYKDPIRGWVRREKSLLNSVDYAFIDFDKDARFAFVLGAVNGRRALLRWDMQSDQQSSIIFEHSELDVESVYQIERTREVYGVELSDGRDMYFDPVWAKRMDALGRALPNVELTVQDSTVDQGRMILKATSSKEPGTFYMFDSIKKSLLVVGNAYPMLGAQNLSSRQWVDYKTRDGLQINAVLTRPRSVPSDKPLPTVILPHGGPWSNDDLEFDWLAQFIADRGYLVLQPNYRGSSGYGKAFLDAGDRQWGLAMQDDLTDGLKYLIDKGLTDAKRVCIVGGSYGGYAALWGVVKDIEQYRCAASFNGVSDIVAMLADDLGSLKSEFYSKRIGDIGAGRKALVAVSPINFVDKIKTPILLVHSKDDGRVDIKQSRRMADKLKAAGKSVEFIEVEKGEHFLENEASRVTFLTALEGFLAKHLAP